MRWHVMVTLPLPCMRQQEGIGTREARTRCVRSVRVFVFVCP